MEQTPTLISNLDSFYFFNSNDDSLFLFIPYLSIFLLPLGIIILMYSTNSK